MYVNLTISEFRRLAVGDTIIVNVNNEYLPAEVLNYAFYNSDTKEPGWEIETDAGFIALDSSYREVVVRDPSKMRLMTLDEFKNLNYGDVFFVRCNNEYLVAKVYDGPSLSESLENILGDGDDWEVGTNVGYVHNDSAYVEEV